MPFSGDGIVPTVQGQIYQERWLLVPKGSEIESRMDVFSDY
jgi:hypothetical protein